MSSPPKLVPLPGPRPTPAEVAVDPRAPATDRRRRTVWAAAAVAALLLTAFVFYRWGAAATPEAPPPVAAPSPAPTGPPTTAEIFAAVAPSVVSIRASHGNTIATGTGVVVNADATIMTALHVVRGATAIQLTFIDGTTSAAAITSADPETDIATLLPATLPSLLVPAVIGGSDQLSVGDNVIAIGNQLGLTLSTTAGVVSGVDRRAPGEGGTMLEGLIQFDAAVNRGSSGGPLLNGQGQTIGIVVALANPTDAGTFIGVGFAVPIGTAVAAGGGDRAPQQ